MGLADQVKKAAGGLAYAVGYAGGKIGEKVREVAESPEYVRAYEAAKANAEATTSNVAAYAGEAASRAAQTLGAAVDTVVPAVKDAASKVVPAVKEAASKAAPAARDAAVKAAPAVKDVVAEAAQAAAVSAMRSGKPASAAAAAAKTAAKAAATNATRAAATAATEAAVKNAADMREADARPHTVRNEKTGQDVVVEAYVQRSGGTKDYDAVYPKGSMGDFGSIGNKAVGMLLILAGVPMLVLPGPGVAAIAAGLYFLGKGSGGGSDEVVQADVEVTDPADGDAPQGGQVA